MRTLPSGKMLYLSAMTLIAMIVANGCQSTPSFSLPFASDQAKSPSGQNASSAGMVFDRGNLKYMIVRPGTEVEWALTSPVTAQPGVVNRGRAVVGPDGTVVLGPYGTARVAGLTLEQASGKLEKHLSAYIKQPRVTLVTVVPSPVFSEISWRKSNAPPPTILAHHQRTPNLKDETIRPAGFQPSPMPEQQDPPFMVQSQQLGLMQGGGHYRKMVPMPYGPNEMNPVLLPEYVIRPPDVLLIESQRGLFTKQDVRGQHLVRLDGTVGLGVYGSVVVAGSTLEQARRSLAAAIHSKMAQAPYRDAVGNIIGKRPPTLDDVIDGLSVDVLAFNSSVYYVITDGAGLGEQVYRFPVTGSETVLDAISHINGLPVVSSRRIWVARRNPGHAGPDSKYPVNWKAITQGGEMATNWQIMPGDRVYVQADRVRTFSTNLSKFLEPVERLLGATLLGAQTVNAIKGNTGGIR